MNFVEKHKEKLFSCINELEKDRELCFYNPKTDFVRKRKLTFSSVIKCFLVMEGSSIQKELLKYTDYDSQAASDSAFCQQRKRYVRRLLSLYFTGLHNHYHAKIHTKGIDFWHVMAQIYVLLLFQIIKNICLREVLQILNVNIFI